ncbi:MAG: SusC/RagA family TonB-linked outer membrane protein [Bacteroidales bacterium]
MKKKLLLRLLFSFLSLLIFGYSAMAQITVSGTVVSEEDEEPLPGVSVIEKGTDNGTTTDSEGSYQIEVPDEEAVLEFSFVGMQTKEVKVEDQKTIDVALGEDVEEIDEVVVTGYGTQKRSDLTGSVSSVQAEGIEGMAVESVQKAMQGRAAGVEVTAQDGVPGGAVDVLVRGKGSFSSNDPVWIVDGVEIETGGIGYRSPSESVLSSLSFDDIESIDILKDAAATAIYGAKGARGVVVIETKEGTKDKETSFDFEISRGYTQPIRTNPVMDGPQWAQWDYERMVNRYGEGSEDVQERLETGVDRGWYELNSDGTPDFSTTPNYDWQDEAYRTGNMTKANLSVRGGNEKTQFYTSLGFNDTEGHVIAYDFDKANYRLNVNHQATDKLSFEARVSANWSEQNTTRLEGAWSSPVRASAGIPPVEPIYDEDGYRGYHGAPRSVYGAYPAHFLNSADLDHNINKNLKNIVNLSANYNITDFLTYRATLGVDYNHSDEEQWYDPRASDGQSDNGVLRDYEHTAYAIQTTQTLNIDKTFGDKHKLDGVAGFETWERIFRRTAARGQNFPHHGMNVLVNAGAVEWWEGLHTERATMGAFSRLNYTYDDKYLLTLTGRYDGSSRFGAENRWGFFPAAAIGWRMSDEDFMAGLSQVDNLLLKLSYGKAGSDAADTYAALGLWSGGTQYMGDAGLYPDQLPNKFLTWEESRDLNLSVNFSAFDGRLSMDLEAYKKWSEELLLDRPLPYSTGWSEISENIGRTLTRGVELTLNTVNIENENFRWTTNFNFAYSRNEILDLLPGQEMLDDRTKVGQAIDDRYIPVWAGVNPADGRPMYHDEDGNITYNPTYDDRQWQGPQEPLVYGGIGNDFQFGNFTASIHFQYSAGNKMYNSDARFWFAGTGDRNQFEKVFTDRWQEPGDVTEVPKPIYGNVYPGNVQAPNTYASHMFERVDYIRLKELNISYNIPKDLLNSVGLKDLRVFVRGSNLITWDNYSGADPEFTDNDFGKYPIGQSITFGVNTQF